MMNSSKRIVHYEDSSCLDMQSVLMEESKFLHDEESSTSESGDPFQRKLREKVYLAEVLAIDKLEKEKSFRTSEVYLGSDMLSEDDIATIIKQRQVLSSYKMKSNYQRSTSKSISSCQSSSASSGSAKIKEIVGVSIDASQCFQQYAASYVSWDVNHNDVWMKRHHTLRRFVAIVSKWITRHRMKKIKDKLVQFFMMNKLFTPEAVRLYVDNDHKTNSDKHHQSQTSSSEKMGDDSKPSYRSGSNINDNVQCLLKPTSLSQLVLGGISSTNSSNSNLTSPKIINANNSKSGGKGVIAAVTSPTKPPSTIASTSSTVAPASVAVNDGQDEVETALRALIDQHMHEINFKQQHHKQASSPASNYDGDNDKMSAKSTINHNVNDTAMMKSDQPQPHQHDGMIFPPLDMWNPYPDTFPSSSSTTTYRHRVGAGVAATQADLIGASIINTIPIVSSSAMDHDDERVPKPVDCSYDMPAWMKHPHLPSASYHPHHPRYKAYLPEPPRRQLDDDWILRPTTRDLTASYRGQHKPCLRNTWLQAGGFLAANTYLLAGQHDHKNDMLIKPDSKLMLSYMHEPDLDRHASGLSCFKDDHRRGLYTRDYHVRETVTSLQPHHPASSSMNKYLSSLADPRDYLSDSESDDEEQYVATSMPPCASKVMAMLCTPADIMSANSNTITSPRTARKTPTSKQTSAPSKTSSTAGKKNPSASTAVTGAKKKLASTSAMAGKMSPRGKDKDKDIHAVSKVEVDAMSVDNIMTVKAVTLERDAHHLRCEEHRLTQRHHPMDVITARLMQVSRDSTCPALAPIIQLPVHLQQQHNTAIATTASSS